MSDIKMSDAFSLPVSGDSIEFYCKSSKGGSFDFDENCVAHAINSHDKLTEQNKMLREALALVVDKIPSHQNIYGGGYMLLLSDDDCRIIKESLNISEL